MTKILLTADWHIKLGQKNVPKQWQKDRYYKLFKKFDFIDYDIHVIAGDIFDNAKPSLEELELFIHFLQNHGSSTIIIGGNHEMLSKKASSLDFLKGLCENFDSVLITEPTSHFSGIDILPYNWIKHYERDPKILPKMNDILVTHVRGTILPHVLPEVDLNIFSKYKIVLAGDLHHYHKQLNILYPGAPLTTSFVRSNDIKKGGIIFDTETLEHEFIDFKLPQLRRVTVDNPDDMVETELHHTIYELHADDATLKTMKDNELLDKRVSESSKEDSALSLDDKSIAEELHEYLSTIRCLKVEDINRIQKTYTEVVSDKYKITEME